jgi:glycosyltransferase involved in cell wall biosynthesis
MKTIAVIPTLNEEKSISDVISETGRHVDMMIIVDSSSDRTPEIISGFSNVALIHERRTGKGIALRRGISHALKAKPSFVLLMDGDGERNPLDIPRLIGKIERGFHLVIGTRKRMRSRKRSILNTFGLWWINLLTGYRLGDAFSGFILFRRPALERISLKSGGFEIEAEIILESWKNRLVASGLPVDVPGISRSRCSGKSMLSINLFFDRWVLRNLGSVPKTKLPLLFVSCLSGFILSKAVLSISGYK